MKHNDLEYCDNCLKGKVVFRICAECRDKISYQLCSKLEQSCQKCEEKQTEIDRLKRIVVESRGANKRLAANYREVVGEKLDLVDDCADKSRIIESFRQANEVAQDLIDRVIELLQAIYDKRFGVSGLIKSSIYFRRIGEVIDLLEGE
jgi:cell fate (sporulation/competence/biofilm development) regulator YmcA (YheA/YmcA/DUF963 family)